MSQRKTRSMRQTRRPRDGEAGVPDDVKESVVGLQMLQQQQRVSAARGARGAAADVEDDLLAEGMEDETGLEGDENLPSPLVHTVVGPTAPSAGAGDLLEEEEGEGEGEGEGEEEEEEEEAVAGPVLRTSRAGANSSSGSWTPRDIKTLRDAVKKHGRNWVEVARLVGKSNVQCKSKVQSEVVSGRMTETLLGSGGAPMGWSKEEVVRLCTAVAVHGHDWVAVARDVRTKDAESCALKAEWEVAAGRMLDPNKRGPPQWNDEEMTKLKEAVQRLGRDWIAVAHYVGTKTSKQCFHKVREEVQRGRIEDPGIKRTQLQWTTDEVVRLRQAVRTYGRDWVTVARELAPRTAAMCQRKMDKEIAAGRAEELGAAKRPRFEWTEEELLRLQQAVEKNGRRWMAVSRLVKTKSNQQCYHKVQTEIAAGRWKIVLPSNPGASSSSSSSSSAVDAPGSPGSPGSPAGGMPPPPPPPLI